MTYQTTQTKIKTMSNLNYLTAQTPEIATERAIVTISIRLNIDWQNVGQMADIEKCACKCNCGETIGRRVEYNGQTVYAAVCEICGEE